MDTCDRLLKIRLLEHIEKMPDMAEELGISIVKKKDNKRAFKRTAGKETKCLQQSFA